jgi:hypothetical protein
MVGLRAVSGCVVTDKVEFYEPVNSPPVFPAGEQPSRLQLGQIIFLVKGGDEPDWTFTFRVRDADINQELRVQWRILRNVINLNQRMEVNEQRAAQTVPVSGTDTRDFDIKVRRDQLEFDNCHRIEIGVSGSFEEALPGEEKAFLERDDDDRADIAQFSFWVWEGDPTAPASAKLVETCAAKLFQPVVPTEPSGAAGAAAQEAP